MKSYLHNQESEKLQEEQLVELLSQIVVDNVFKQLNKKNFMITPKLKDQILIKLVNESPAMQYSLEYEEDAENFDVSPEHLKAIFNEFEEKGFVRLEKHMQGAFVTIKSKAHTFVLAGGYEAEIQLMDLEIQKLKTELQALQSQIGKDKFDRIMTSLSMFSTWALSLLK